MFAPATHTTVIGGNLQADFVRRNWSVNQKVISIGSGASRGLTVKNVMQEFHGHEKECEKVKMTIRTDSVETTGMLHRVGCGKSVSVQCLTSSIKRPCVMVCLRLSVSTRGTAQQTMAQRS